MAKRTSERERSGSYLRVSFRRPSTTGMTRGAGTQRSSILGRAGKHRRASRAASLEPFGPTPTRPPRVVRWAPNERGRGREQCGAEGEQAPAHETRRAPAPTHHRRSSSREAAPRPRPWLGAGGPRMAQCARALASIHHIGQHGPQPRDARSTSERRGLSSICFFVISSAARRVCVGGRRAKPVGSGGQGRCEWTAAAAAYL